MMDENKDISAEEKVPPPREAFPELKKMREARGLSLKAIFETTRVGLVSLTAVENGDFNLLPPPVYARNFIRKYARAVGIDEKPILDRYEKYLESLNPPLEEIEIRKPWPETGRRYRFLIISLTAVIAAGILVSAIFLYDQGGKPPSPVAPVVESQTPAQDIPVPTQTEAVPNPPTQTTAVPNAPARKADVQNAPVQITAPESAPAPAGKTILPPVTGKNYHLVIEARELTWIRITEDQNPSYQVLLKPGDKIERMASDYFQLDIGNAGGVDLTFQGESLGSLGKQAQIIHMRLPEKGAERKLLP
jgi:cytoskeletal protein RodZ